ncbi:sugar hydrolase [Niastella yeongjuensis]|uniref:Sugar hydrolase n=1 Tax=Niastella yeongjuensis TaxID=354355 RepID=A0A1V9F4P8_9BACT|nr:GH92 family glycosyl hydrolase [Niastella yeongjuensis]OQP53370.1 sugar hydrolase [Niastella yeongjuensis]SEP13889.1 alpha-1,2-mannosidase, putative [Niastella yeongjuensis]
MRGRHHIRNLVSFFSILLIHSFSFAQHYTDYVNPYIGTAGHAHVFLGANVPFGAVQLGPDNIFRGWDWCSGYNYTDSIIKGFSHTHLSGTGMPDLGDVLIMPFTGPVKTGDVTQGAPTAGPSSHFSHKNEKVQPGYYAVTLDDYKIQVQLTATERVGFHQYQFPAGEAAHILINLKEGIGDRVTATHLEKVNDSTFYGYRFSRGWAPDQRLYFAIRLSAPIQQFESDSMKGVISFTKAPGTVMLKVGISPVNSVNALANIDAEIPNWNFAKVKQDADAKWNKELGRITIETKDAAAKKIFYTSLYHTMIDPALFNDANGEYWGPDKQNHKATFQNYTIFSLWDTYRALNPLYTIMQPDRVNDMINTMLAIYQQQGKLPIWHLAGNETNLMPGMSGVQIVAEAYLKGYRGFDTALAFEAVKNTSLRDEFGLNYVKSLAYIPNDRVQESVAKAMEYCISDGSIALMAKQMGRAADAELFTKRSHYYRNYFDSTTKFFRGKNEQGQWNQTFGPGRTSHPWIDDYCEGNAWQYTWLVPQDVEGLIKLLGGDTAFVNRLDEFFKLKIEFDPKSPPDISGMIGQYAHGNEPGHHTTYLYAYAGQQWKTAEKVRYILKNLYDNTTDGISGNEDCGQMSAWYIFSSLGFYPVFPASGAYVLGSPLFDKATIQLPNKKTFSLKVEQNSPKNIYIQRVILNGKPWPNAYIMHKQIMEGGTMTIVMGDKPGPPLNIPRSQY